MYYIKLTSSMRSELLTYLMATYTKQIGKETEKCKNVQIKIPAELVSS